MLRVFNEKATPHGVASHTDSDKNEGGSELFNKIQSDVFQYICFKNINYSIYNSRIKPQEELTEENSLQLKAKRTEH